MKWRSFVNKKLVKRMIMLGSLTLVLLAVGIGGVLYVGGDYIFKYFFQSMLEEEVGKFMGEESDEYVTITNPEILMGLNLSIDALEIAGSIDENGKISKQSNDETVKLEPELKPAQTLTPEVKSTPEGVVSEEKQSAIGVQVSKSDLQQAMLEKVNSLTSAVPAGDKMAMMQLIVKRVGKDQINYLASLVADGVSAKDLEIAKSIARASFPPDEMEIVYAYYRKYAYLIP